MGPDAFDLKFKARPSTDYIELAFYNKDFSVKRPINKRYSTLEGGRDDVFKANGVDLPCGMRGLWTLTVSMLGARISSVSRANLFLMKSLSDERVPYS